jgi:hypothetical protein
VLGGTLDGDETLWTSVLAGGLADLPATLLELGYPRRNFWTC